MKDIIKIGIIGLGQVGNYLYNELNIRKNNIELQTNKKIIIPILNNAIDVLLMNEE